VKWKSRIEESGGTLRERIGTGVRFMLLDLEVCIVEHIRAVQVVLVRHGGGRRHQSLLVGDSAYLALGLSRVVLTRPAWSFDRANAALS